MTRHKLDAKREKLIRERLKTYSVDDLCEAINGCAQSDFHMGRDPAHLGKLNNGIGLILRDAEHIDKFRDLAAHPPPSARMRFGSKQRDSGIDPFASIEEKL